MEQSILEAIDYVRYVNKKRLSIANILSRLVKLVHLTKTPDPLKKNFNKWFLKD